VEVPDPLPVRARDGLDHRAGNLRSRGAVQVRVPVRESRVQGAHRGHVKSSRIQRAIADASSQLGLFLLVGPALLGVQGGRLSGRSRISLQLAHPAETGGRCSRTRDRLPHDDGTKRPASATSTYHRATLGSWNNTGRDINQNTTEKT